MVNRRRKKEGTWKKEENEGGRDWSEKKEDG